MKILVTGIDGFVGPFLRDFLRTQGHTVVGTYLISQNTTAQDYFMDLTDRDCVASVVQKIRPEGVCHLAGFSSVRKSFDQPELCMKINARGTANLLQALETGDPSNPQIPILIVSSAEVYGTPRSIPITEDHPLSPESPYGSSRIHQEAIVEEFTSQTRNTVIIARSFNHTGPTQTPEFVIPRFAKQISDIERGIQQELRVGNLEAIRDFMDVRDTVRAYGLLLEKGVSGQKYNVCSQQGVKIGDILQTLMAMSEAKIQINGQDDQHRQTDIPVLIGSNRKLRETTGWIPQIPLSQTLKDILHYWRLQPPDCDQ